MSHTLFILFGATGDLAKRYLLPALANIRERNTHLDIIAVGRRPYSDDNFRDFIREEGASFFPSVEKMEIFLQGVSYTQVELDQDTHYDALVQSIQSFAKRDMEIVIYLSIATAYFTHFLAHIAPHQASLPPIRVVFEKPFGSDLATARLLQSQIEEVFQEEQVYRIDHYVAKSGIENLLAFRFANIFFEPIWNHLFIDHIQITASETLGIGDRGGFYESAGALRDMVQNHLFQTLALVIMEKPQSLSPESIQRAKTRALKSFRLGEDLSERVVFGQYDGYRSEKNVSESSNTETFVALRIMSTLPLWKDVPLYIRTGKSLDRKSTRIVIELKKVENIGFANLTANRIVIEIQPDESIEIHYSRKGQKEGYDLVPVVSTSRENETSKGAYEKLLEDVITGDRTLFTTWEMLESTWETIDALIHCRESCPILHQYPMGSRGPRAMDDLLARDGREWYEDVSQS